MTNTTDPQRPEVDDPRVLALAAARQQLAHRNPFNAVCPPWDGLSEQEQHLSLLDARSYLHAAMNAGLVPDATAAVSSSGRAALLHETADRGAEARVRALHQPADDWSWRSFGCRHDGQHAQFCAHCRTCYPCQTITALDSEPADGPRRVAAEEQPAETQTHSCRNCEGIDPDTCLMNPNRPPEQCPNSEFDGYGLQCQKPAGHNLCTFEEEATTTERPVVGEQPDTQETRPALRCNWAHTRTEHLPHGWEPQPGMDPVRCPGYPQP